MKQFILLLFVLSLANSIYAQSPEMMSYQAVIRDADNKLLNDANVGVQISLLQGSASGTAVYTETHMTNTNTNGLISIEIGNGNASVGSFAAIDWAAGPYFIKTETDPSGGTNYSITGTSQLLSVPYALYAEKANIPSRKRSVFISPGMISSAMLGSGVSHSSIGGWGHPCIDVPEGGTRFFSISLPVPADYNGEGFTVRALYTSTTTTGTFNNSLAVRGSAVGGDLGRGTGSGGLILDSPAAVNMLAEGTTFLKTP